MLLNDMPLNKFIVLMVWASAGALLFLIFRIINAIKTDASTPYKFSWRHMSKGLLKLLAALILIPWILIFSDETIPLLLKFVFSWPENFKIPADINGYSAFLIGLLIDAAIHKGSKKILRV